MTAYLVRIADGGEFVGIVSTDEPETMFIMIDEFCDPSDCEYAEIPNGMIFARDDAPSVPDESADDESKEPADYIKGASLCEEWLGALDGGHDLRWKTVVPSYSASS